MGTFLIARFTLQEVIRRRLFLAIVILSIILLASFTLLFSLLISQSRPVNQDPRVLFLAIGAFMSVPAIWLVYLLSSLLTVLLTAGMLSGEIEAGTFVIIVPKPLRRSEIVFGKWLCYAGILSLYTALLFVAFLGIIYWKTGYWPSTALNSLAILELVMFVLLGMATLGSSLVPTLVNGASILVLFIGVQIVSFVQLVAQYAAPAQSDALQNVVTISSLLVPTDALWHGSSFYLTLDSLDILRAINLNSPFTSTTPTAPAFLIWAVVYSLVLPVLGAWRFQGRDL